MEKTFPRGEENFVREQPDDDDDQHDSDDLVHRVEFAAVMKQMPQAKAGLKLRDASRSEATTDLPQRPRDQNSRIAPIFPQVIGKPRIDDHFTVIVRGRRMQKM